MKSQWTLKFMREGDTLMVNFCYVLSAGLCSISRLATQLLALVACFSIAMVSTSAMAEEGVTRDSIVVGRIIALEGPAGSKGREQEVALQAYFSAVNAAGGIFGRKIELHTTNEDLRTDEDIRRIYDGQRPFALFLVGGTVGSTVAMNYGSRLGIPFVAPNSGANVFHRPVNPLVFNVRARYRDEVAAAIKHFSRVGQVRIAMIGVDDAFGRDAVENYADEIRAVGSTSVYVGQFSSDKPDFNKHIQALVKTEPQAVICVGSSKRIAELITLARQLGITSTFMTLSNNSSTGFAKELGPNSRGVLVSQVTPPPTNFSTRLSYELQQLLVGRSGAAISYSAMEAYVSAKVLVEGLRRAGPNLTRQAFVQALQSIHHFDLGGLEIDYSATNRTGSNFVELSILRADGKYVR